MFSQKWWALFCFSPEGLTMACLLYVTESLLQSLKHGFLVRTWTPLFVEVGFVGLFFLVHIQCSNTIFWWKHNHIWGAKFWLRTIASNRNLSSNCEKFVILACSSSSSLVFINFALIYTGTHSFNKDKIAHLMISWKLRICPMKLSMDFLFKQILKLICSIN